MPEPLTEADQINDIAFGFMASKALFAALHLEVFTHLDTGAMDARTLAAACGVHPDRAQTLLTALAALGLVVLRDGRAENAPAASAFLVKGARHDFGDYLRLQVDRQMYRLLDQIEPALRGALRPGHTAGYAQWFDDPEEARLYSESQHAGSLGPARTLARRVDLASAERLLDVGGGTGAMAITLCEAFPGLSATVLDFPTVADLGEARVAEAGLGHRIAYRRGDAVHTDWPAGQDAVLMSYLFSGVPASAHRELLARAARALRPGGRLLVHDFVVASDRSGPRNAALWQLQHTAFTPEARSLDVRTLEAEVSAAGFREITTGPLIPGMTMLAEALKP